MAWRASPKAKRLGWVLEEGLVGDTPLAVMLVNYNLENTMTTTFFFKTYGLPIAIATLLSGLEIQNVQAVEGGVPTYQRPASVPATQYTYTFSPLKDPAMNAGFNSTYIVRIFKDQTKTPKPVNIVYSNGLCPGPSANNTCASGYSNDRFTVNYGGVHDLNGTPINTSGVPAVPASSGYLPSPCFFAEEDSVQTGRPGSSVWGGKNCGQFRRYTDDLSATAVNSFALEINSIYPYEQAASGNWLISSPDHPEMKIAQTYMVGSMPNTTTSVPPIAKITSYRVKFKAKLEYVTIDGCRQTTEQACNLQEAVHAGIYVPVQYYNYNVSDPNHGKVLSVGASLYDSRDHHSVGTSGQYQATATGLGYVKGYGTRMANLDQTMQNAIVAVPRADTTTNQFSAQVPNFPSLSSPTETVTGGWVTVDYDFLPAIKESIQNESKVNKHIAPFDVTKADGSYLYTEFFNATNSNIYNWIDAENYTHFFPSWVSFYIEASRKGIITLLVKDFKVEIGVNESQ